MILIKTTSWVQVLHKNKNIIWFSDCANYKMSHYRCFSSKGILDFQYFLQKAL